ncbi:MAG: MFS transporter [Burkholderiales bacterium]|nr:MFS transporter [Burkholderiales bacterium]
MSNSRPARILPAIVAAQFAGSAVWFAGNAVMGDLKAAWGLPAESLGQVLSAVQLGFIAGTLVFAFLTLADRFSPRVIFTLCCLGAALANAAVLASPPGLAPLLASRFATGFFLAGIYPVGMKIASGWYRSGLGNALGFLVGALVLGTAFPHLLKFLGQAWPWQAVLAGVSLVAAAGGLLMFAAVPDGPYLTRAARFDPHALQKVFRSRRFRASAFGYFGHMWELYAFWAFVPWIIAAFAPAVDASLWSFGVIAAGAAGCAVGGLVSLKLGSARVAVAQLAASGTCCLVSPLVFLFAPPLLILAFLVFWGVVVAGDSPQFSALNAANAPAEATGSALIAANCIGFAITIASITLLNAMVGSLSIAYLYLLLVPGPLLGLLAMRPLLKD